MIVKNMTIENISWLIKLKIKGKVSIIKENWDNGATALFNGFSYPCFGIYSRAHISIGTDSILSSMSIVYY